jgi:hypothetical protein
MSYGSSSNGPFDAGSARPSALESDIFEESGDLMGNNDEIDKWMASLNDESESKSDAHRGAAPAQPPPQQPAAAPPVQTITAPPPELFPGTIFFRKRNRHHLM